MATIQELLEQRAGGVGQARSDVNFLLKQIQQRMRTAQEQDRQRAKNIKSAGKTGLDAIKTRRDFLLAKRGNPNLSFKDFFILINCCLSLGHFIINLEFSIFFRISLIKFFGILRIAIFGPNGLINFIMQRLIIF